MGSYHINLDVMRGEADNFIEVAGSRWTTLDLSMVGAEGFEPPTLWSQTRCATRLRYAPT